MSTTTRIAVLGAGWWAVENHIPILKSLPDVEIVGVCRPGHDELRKIQERFDIPFGTEDYRELLKLKHIDGVVVSSPHHLHFDHAFAALKEGYHVMCEKPMALHTAEAMQLAKFAQDAQLHILVPYGWNYTDFAEAARNIVQQRMIGDVEHIQMMMGSALRDLLGGTGSWFADNTPSRPELTTWSDPVAGGGYAHGQLTHGVALLLRITELVPVEVFAMMKNSSRGADLYDSVCCSFKNGATGVFGGAGTIPPGSAKQMDMRIFGTEGVVVLDIERPRLEVHSNDGQIISHQMQIQPGQYDCIRPVHAFVDLARGQLVDNRSSGVLGARVVSFIDATLRSVKSRSPVTVEDVDPMLV
jgi:predicted dehydrogenase